MGGRTASVSRDTLETQITVTVDIDGTACAQAAQSIEALNGPLAL